MRRRPSVGARRAWSASGARSVARARSTWTRPTRRGARGASALARRRSARRRRCLCGRSGTCGRVRRGSGVSGRCPARRPRASGSSTRRRGRAIVRSLRYVGFIIEKFGSGSFPLQNKVYLWQKRVSFFDTQSISVPHIKVKFHTVKFNNK